ncbi:hypothetical protein HPC49_08395 [Pyxidicoccus fallax]|uniref:RiboL-PSP-HEPN domain-containing protein n=1 Tax=Pyxidicoccus fallax TaxID=394095 RepID=A0A848LCA0_9BACT|nr:hypothetical protein [Pyxidicoccus fallax]NMO13911.1 hypothetical protein [Pyxidicoccus fallax]NPC78269.1 hypothetical protein [Pyxidicoccus fallax]
MANKRPARVLPKREHRPPVSDALAAFQDALTDINHFYWLAVAGAHALKAATASGTARAAIPTSVSSHLNLSTSELKSLVDGQSSRLRQLCLVDAVAHYEAFLERTVRKHLEDEPLPDKSIKMQIPIDQATSAETAADFVKRLWVGHRTAEVLGENYSKRPTAVDSVLGINVVKADSEHKLNLQHLHAAQLFRNCIVHSRGLTDDRTFEGCKGSIPSLVLDQPLPLDEALFHKLLAALWAHAQDIDLLLRTTR